MIIWWNSIKGAQSTDPGVNNVRNGTTYKINGSNYTGNMVEPIANQVLLGVVFGSNSSLTGTLGSVTNVIERLTIVGRSVKANVLRSR